MAKFSKNNDWLYFFSNRSDSVFLNIVSHVDEEIISKIYIQDFPLYEILNFQLSEDETKAAITSRINEIYFLDLITGEVYKQYESNSELYDCVFSFEHEKIFYLTNDRKISARNSENEIIKTINISEDCDSCYTDPSTVMFIKGDYLFVGNQIDHKFLGDMSRGVLIYDIESLEYVGIIDDVDWLLTNLSFSDSKVWYVDRNNMLSYFDYSIMKSIKVKSVDDVATKVEEIINKIIFCESDSSVILTSLKEMFKVELEKGGYDRVLLDVNRIYNVEFSDNSKFCCAIASKEQITKYIIIDVERKKIIAEMISDGGGYCGDFSPDNHNFASSVGGELLINDVESLKTQKKKQLHDGMINVIKYINNNQILTAGDDGSVKIYDVIKDQIIFSSYHDSAVLYADQLDDNTIIFAVYEKYIDNKNIAKFYKISKSSKTVESLSIPEYIEPVINLVYQPQVTLAANELVFSDGNRLYFYNTDTDEFENTENGKYSPYLNINSIDADESKQFIVASIKDKAILLLDYGSKEIISTFYNYPHRSVPKQDSVYSDWYPVKPVSRISPDKKYILTGTFDGNLMLWNIANYTSIPEVEYEAEASIRIYPNPANNTLYIDDIDQNYSIEYQINDINGKMLLSGTLRDTGINIRSLSTGVYYIRINANGMIYNDKFMKE